MATRQIMVNQFFTGYRDGAAFIHDSVTAASKHGSARRGIFVVYGTDTGITKHKLTKGEINSFLKSEGFDKRRRKRPRVRGPRRKKKRGQYRR